MQAIQAYHHQHGVSLSALCDALTLPRSSYYRHVAGEKASQGTSIQPVNKLTDTEQQDVLDLLHSERFQDSTPYDVYYTLLDQGQYHCSVRSMYRLLEQRGESQDRRDQRNHRDAVKPELIALNPNEVWSWDITKLLSTNRMVYYYLYVIMDIYSRYVVGWMLAEQECQHLAKRLIQKTALRQSIQPNQLILHADNGPSMTSGTVGQLLEHLGIMKSHNRPYTSSDNPFSESHFKTLKYCPSFPKRFDHLEEAETFCRQFFRWYNLSHFHSGIHYLTPETVHYQRDEEVLEKRHHVLLRAFQDHPNRFAQRPTRKILQPVYINPPQTVEISTRQCEATMA